jgi:nucleotide-binding universal stress UspA family protein
MITKTKNILVAVKGNQAGEDAFRLACELAKENKAKVYAVYIIEVALELPLDAAVDTSQGETILSRIEALGQEEKCSVEAEYLQARHAGPAILQETINKKAELIILGIRFRQHLRSFAIGSTPSYILKHAHCPVILWRERLVEAAHASSLHL